jgi:hypothetical protein
MEIKDYCKGNYDIICSCEGSAEEDVINWLLDEDKLLFSREQLVYKKITRIRSVKEIENKFLNLDYEDKSVVIFRIIDSRNEKFTLGNLYRDRFDVINYNTNPEIEILIIIEMGDLQKYTNQSGKNKLKPSEYATRQYKIKKIKQSGTFADFFDNDIDSLVNSIREHKSKLGKGHFTICDLLK